MDEQQERAACQQAFVESSWYHVGNLGSRDWSLYWSGWQAARAAQGQRPPVEQASVEEVMRLAEEWASAQDGMAMQPGDDKVIEAEIQRTEHALRAAIAALAHRPQEQQAAECCFPSCKNWPKRFVALQDAAVKAECDARLAAARPPEGQADSARVLLKITRDPETGEPIPTPVDEADRDAVLEPTQTTKEAWWAGYRAGKGLPADTPRQDALSAPPKPTDEPPLYPDLDNHSGEYR